MPHIDSNFFAWDIETALFCVMLGIFTGIILALAIREDKDLDE